MKFADLINQGMIRKIPLNTARAKSLIKMSEQSIQTIKLLPHTQAGAATITRELYESLRQVLEAKGYERGYKFENHESLVPFIEEILQLPQIAKDFDRLRKIRNGINYYGDDVPLETMIFFTKRIPLAISQIILK